MAKDPKEAKLFRKAMKARPPKGYVPKDADDVRPQDKGKGSKGKGKKR
jgi:hypothetical protein